MITSHSRFWLSLLSAIGLVSAGSAMANPATWTAVDGTVPAGGFEVDPQSRMESLAFYNTVYLASEGAASRMGWTGVYSGTCTPGTTSAAYREDVRRRVNYFRTLCGLPSVTFDADPAPNDGPASSPTVPAGTPKRECAQAIAYMNSFSEVFIENYQLRHSPTASSGYCYSAKAWNGAWHSNLALGYSGPGAIDIYMADDDLTDDQSNNFNVGHRRWILYSRARDMSTGDTPRGEYISGGTAYPILPANALYVTGVFHPSADSPKKFVTWPSAGYFPSPLRPQRWSISFPAATFPASTASIQVTGPSGAAVTTRVLSANQSNIGDNTLVFEPLNLPAHGEADQTFTVTVSGISGTGVPTSHTWTTTFFNPAVLGIPQALTGPARPPAAGSDYTFDPAPLAQEYSVQVTNPGEPGTFAENADTPVPDITTDKTGTYPVLQGAASLSGITFGPRSGTKSFHLCFPPDSSEPDFLPHSQSFALGPEMIPAADSAITFYDYFRWLFTNNRLSLELSADGGSYWTEIYGRNGAFTYSAGGSYSSTGWDSSWKNHTVSLAAWAGKPVRLRFILRPGGFSFDGQDIHHGCYVDDITLTNVRILSGHAVANQDHTVFRLDDKVTGSPLQADKTYLLRVRSRFGSRFLGYSPAFAAVPLPPGGFETAYPWLAATPEGDADGDGISNLIEFAFGLNPSWDGDAAGMPQPVLSPEGINLSFTVPAGISDLTYGAECTTDFLKWDPVANAGTAATPAFTVPVVPGQNCFVRLRVSQIPPP